VPTKWILQKISFSSKHEKNVSSVTRALFGFNPAQFRAKPSSSPHTLSFPRIDKAKIFGDE
jgi:hypothetical protein